MSNLLPIEYEKIQKKRARARAILLTSEVALACAGVALLALLPLYITLHAERISIEGRVKTVRDLQQGGQLGADRAEMARIRSVIDAIPYLKAPQGKPAEALQAALSKLPSTISIDSITYSPGEKGELVLVGISTRRDDITIYRDALRTVPLFSSVTIPVSALAGAEDGRFVVTVAGNF